MLFASWILIKLDTNGEEGLGTNPIQWRHDDVITDFTVGWLRTKNLVYTDIYMHFLFNLHASVCVVHAKHRRGVAPPRTVLVSICEKPLFRYPISSHEFEIPLSQNLKVFRTEIFIQFLRSKFHYLSFWLGFNLLGCKDQKLGFISSKFPWIYEIENPLSLGSWLKGFLTYKWYSLPYHSPK